MKINEKVSSFLWLAVYMKISGNTAEGMLSLQMWK